MDHMILLQHYSGVFACPKASFWRRILHGITLKHFHAGGGGGGWVGGGQCILVMWAADTLICHAWKGQEIKRI